VMLGVFGSTGGEVRALGTRRGGRGG